MQEGGDAGMRDDDDEAAAAQPPKDKSKRRKEREAKLVQDREDQQRKAQLEMLMLDDTALQDASHGIDDISALLPV